MRRLTRYVLFELVSVFLLALCALTLLMLLFGVAKEALDQGLGPAQIVRMIPYILPQSLRLTVPATILFSVCLVYGRMAGSNEVVAIKALGINPLAILWPAGVLVFLLSLGTVWLNDLAAGWGRNGVQRVVIDAAEQIAYGMLRTHRSYSTSHFALNVKRVEGRILHQLTLSLNGGRDNRAVTIRAEEAELRADSAEGTLQIVCRNGTVTTIAGDEPVSYRFDEFKEDVPLANATSLPGLSAVPSRLPLHEIRSEMSVHKAKTRRQREELAAKAAFQMFSGDFAALANPEWLSDEIYLQGMLNHQHRLDTEPHRRWAAGFSCVCFALVGAPLAIRLRNSDFLTTFFRCFLFVLVVYYPLLMYGVDQAKSGSLPPYVVWLGNIILLVWGAWLLRRVLRF